MTWSGSQEARLRLAVLISSLATYAATFFVHPLGGFADFTAFSVWTLLLSATLPKVITFSVTMSERRTLCIGFPTLMAVGASALGLWLVFVVTARLILGGLYSAFSIPVWHCWLVGTISCITLWLSERFAATTLKAAQVTGIFATLMIAIAVVGISVPRLRGVTSVLIVRRLDDSARLTVDPRGLDLDLSDKVFLEEIGATGMLRVYSTSKLPSVDSARCFVILTGPVTSVTTLFLPRSGAIAYFQSDGGHWESLPHGVARSQHEIELSPSLSGPCLTDVRIDRPDGGGTGRRGLIDWCEGRRGSLGVQPKAVTTAVARTPRS